MKEKREQILTLIILIFLLVVLLSLLVGRIIWASEGELGNKKDCGQEVKIEVGGRYLIELERTYNANVLYVYSTPQSYVTSIRVAEVSNSGKYALVHQMNEEKPYWAKVRDLKIIERLPEREGITMGSVTGPTTSKSGSPPSGYRVADEEDMTMQRIIDGRR